MGSFLVYGLFRNRPIVLTFSLDNGNILQLTQHKGVPKMAIVNFLPGLTNIASLWDYDLLTRNEIDESIIVMGVGYANLQDVYNRLNQTAPRGVALYMAIEQADKEGRIVYGLDVNALNQILQSNGLMVLPNEMGNSLRDIAKLTREVNPNLFVFWED